METMICECGGIMHHSDTMDDPQDNGVPFWQCEMCGEHIDETLPQETDE